MAKSLSSLAWMRQYPFSTYYLNLKVVTMSDNKQDTSTQELDKTRKFERRSSNRVQVVQLKKDLPKEDEDELSVRFRPEVIAIGLMVIALLILTAIAI